MDNKLKSGYPTGIKDRLGRMIRLGDTVQVKQDFSGKVVLANGAFRVDYGDAEALKFNSSLLFQEGGKRRVLIIEKG